MTEAVAIEKIRIDGGTQPRVAINEPTVREYAEHMQGGKVLPPIDIFFDGAEYWLADGFHRYHAIKALGQPALTSIVHPGTRRDAVLFSVGANVGHGLQRTNADKRKAVTTVLSDSEWAKWSGREIAERCGVSHGFVNELRASLATVASEKAPVTYTTKHGTEATMNVEKIGRTSKTRAAVGERIETIRTMASRGHSVQQIAAAVEIGEVSVRRIVVREQIDVPAQRSVGKSRRHDSDRIVDRMVMDAENLTADVNLIVFGDLDRERLGTWADALVASKKSLDAFIRRLIKEQQKHGEAA